MVLQPFFFARKEGVTQWITWANADGCAAQSLHVCLAYQSQYADGDEVGGDHIVQQLRHEQDGNTRDEGQQRDELKVECHGLFPLVIGAARLGKGRRRSKEAGHNVIRIGLHSLHTLRFTPDNV